LADIASTNGEGAANYAEIILALHADEPQPRRMVIGVPRRPISESEMRQVMRERLRLQLQTDV
jgi:hypothetical protein